MSTELIQIETQEVEEILRSLPLALEENTKSVDNAVSFGRSLLDRIQKEGMTPELDQACNNYLVKARKTLELAEARRKPGTKFMDDIRSAFTSLEAQLKQTTKNSVPNNIQAERDAYARKLAEEKRRKEQEQQRKLAIEKEKVSLKSEAELKIRNLFDNTLTAALKQLSLWLENVSLDDYEQTVSTVKKYSEVYAYETFDALKPSLASMYLSAQEIDHIVTIAKTGKYEVFAKEFKQAVAEAKQMVLDKLPGKKEHLEALAKADKEEALRLQQIQKDNERKEAERLQKEEADRKLRAEQDAEASRQADIANTLFEHESAISAEVVEEQAGQIREGFKIEINNPAGFLNIVSFYFSREGKSEAIEKLNKKTLGSMVTYAEKCALKGDKIESPFLVYHEVFKTIAKK